MNTEESRQKIVNTAIEMFNARGCKGVTMDDIAQSLHMSKRTLYEIFENKEALLEACLQLVQAQLKATHYETAKRVEEPMLLALYITKSMALSNHRYNRLISETKRYYPEVHSRFFALHTEEVRWMLQRGIEYAREKGYLREGIDAAEAVDQLYDLLQSHRIKENDNCDTYASQVGEMAYTYFRGLMTVDSIRRYEAHEDEYKHLIEEITTNNR